jgi:magnesium-transporting ATPase (P-type)
MSQSGDPFQGTILFIIVVTIITAICVSLLKVLITSIVSMGIEKKVEHEDRINKEARRSAIIFFILVCGAILILGANHIAIAFSRPIQEIVFAGFLILIFGLAIMFMIYRKPTEQLYNRVRGIDQEEDNNN